MDAFYASIEQRDNPKLKGKPVVVGGEPQSRGVVASASYEARKFGIRSAMSCAAAYRICPQTIFVPPDFTKYVEASRRLRQIFEMVTPVIEPLALDEAYLDVTQNLLGEPIAKTIAALLKKRIQEELNLTASAGVGPNKFIAKLASEFKKPDGLVVIPPEKVFKFIENLPVEKLWGVGPATAKKLHTIGIRTTADIRKQGLPQLEKAIGSYASFLHALANGEDDREVDTSSEPKSRGSETTLVRDTTNSNELLEHITTQSEEVAQDLQKHQYMGRTITLKIKYKDFTSITRSRTLHFPTHDADTISKTAADLLFKDTEVGSRPVRLIGVSVSNFITETEPLQLWFDFEGRS